MNVYTPRRSIHEDLANDLLADRYKLQDELEELREENRQLRADLGATADIRMVERIRRLLDVLPQRCRIVAALLGAADVATHERLLQAITLPGRDEREIKLVQVNICLARKALTLHGIEIETVRGVGYRMLPEMKAKLRALLDEVAP